MPYLRRKTRMVSFRVSEDQYESLRTNSLKEGSASVSDYARAVLFRLMDGGSNLPSHPLHARLDQLGGNVEALDRDVRHLLKVIEPKEAE
jgi:hypothetical protein